MSSQWVLSVNMGISGGHKHSVCDGEEALRPGVGKNYDILSLGRLRKLRDTASGWPWDGSRRKRPTLGMHTAASLLICGLVPGVSAEGSPTWHPCALRR